MLSHQSSICAVVPVSDIERARRFYCDDLGLREVPVAPAGGLTLQAGGATMLFCYESPHAGRALHTLATWDVDNLEEEMENLEEHGVRFEDYDLPDGPTTDNGIASMDEVKSAWFKDPDGNVLCLHQLDPALRKLLPREGVMTAH